MTTLAPISVNRQSRCYVVEVEYEIRGAKHVYIVLLQPDPKNLNFKALEVKNKHSGRKLTSDITSEIEARAIRRLLKSMYEKTKPLKRSRFELPERIERSVVLTLLEWNMESRSPGQITKRQLSQLYTCMRTINDKIAALSEQARGQVRNLPAGYFHQEKTSALVALRKQHPDITDEMRDFMSAVLGRAYAWKNNVIPEEELEIIEKHLPGFRLMLSQG